MINNKLKELKEESKMSTNEIAEKSGIPASTVSRILSGRTENASFDNVCGIVIALDGSVDELVGIPSVQKDCSDELVDLYKNELEHERKLNRRLITLLVIVFLIIFFIIIFDALNGRIGYIRY